MRSKWFQSSLFVPSKSITLYRCVSKHEGHDGMSIAELCLSKSTMTDITRYQDRWPKGTSQKHPKPQNHRNPTQNLSRASSSGPAFPERTWSQADYFTIHPAGLRGIPRSWATAAGQLRWTGGWTAGSPALLGRSGGPKSPRGRRHRRQTCQQHGTVP